jgi:CheY-like chemotaxis protein
MCTVLVVDDDPCSLAVMPKLLVSDQYQVVTASDGTGALKLIDSPLGESIRLMLLDVSLPDMTGLVLADRAKVAIPNAKVIYISGYPAEKGLTDRWIQKPINVPVLQRRVLTELFGG